MKVKELLEMNAIAGYGDWHPGENSLGFLSLNGLERYYTKIDDINTGLGVLEFYKINANHHYVLGRKVSKNVSTKKGIEIEEKLEVILKMTLTPVEYVGQSFLNVDEVEVKSNARCYGIALQMYRYFLKELKHQLMGDEYQFFGARKLWAKISRMTDVTVDIIDVSTNSYIEKNVIVHQGSDDWDYDNRVWGKDYSGDMKDVRLILIGL